ncbi:hypothetical protein [Streptomyces sp. NRRL F-4474]|nr:hypothetical protein [Streptomyces sp. NRRL F-4474]
MSRARTAAAPKAPSPPVLDPRPSARHLKVRLTFLRDGEEFPYDLSLDLS